MKKRYILILTALALLLPGCGAGNTPAAAPEPVLTAAPLPTEEQPESTAPAETELQETPEPGRIVEHDYVTNSLIRVYTEHERYGESAERLTFFIDNGGGVAREYGTPYEVLRETEQGWVHAAPESNTWTLELYSTQPGELRAWRVWVGGLGPGNYRLIKEIGGKWYAAPFVICADAEAEVTLERPYGREPLSALPAKYGEAEAAENGDLVTNASGRAADASALERFLTLTDAGASALLRIVRFDEAGRAIVSDVEYNGVRYCLTEDATRLGGEVRTRYFSYLTVRDGQALLTDCCPGEEDTAWLLNRAEEEVLFSFDADTEAWEMWLRKRMETYEWRRGLLYVPSPEGDTFVGIGRESGPFVELRRSGMKSEGLGGFEELAPELARWIGIRWEDTERFVLIGENRSGSEYPYVAVTMEICRETRPLANAVGTESFTALP